MNFALLSEVWPDMVQKPKKKKLKRRKAKGLVGQRSMFSRAGGRGFYQEGKKT